MQARGYAATQRSADAKLNSYSIWRECVGSGLRHAQGTRRTNKRKKKLQGSFRILSLDAKAVLKNGLHKRWNAGAVLSHSQEMELLMNNLQQIIVIAAWLSVPLSIWGIIYFVGRMVTHFHINKNLGDMPSAEEIHQLYEKNNAIIQYKQHSPTEKNLRS